MTGSPHRQKRDTALTSKRLPFQLPTQSEKMYYLSTCLSVLVTHSDVAHSLDSLKGKRKEKSICGSFIVLVARACVSIRGSTGDFRISSRSSRRCACDALAVRALTRSGSRALLYDRYACRSCLECQDACAKARMYDPHVVSALVDVCVQRTLSTRVCLRLSIYCLLYTSDAADD